MKNYELFRNKTDNAITERLHKPWLMVDGFGDGAENARLFSRGAGRDSYNLAGARTEVKKDFFRSCLKTSAPATPQTPLILLGPARIRSSARSAPRCSPRRTKPPAYGSPRGSRRGGRLSGMPKDVTARPSSSLPLIILNQRLRSVLRIPKRLRLFIVGKGGV